MGGEHRMKRTQRRKKRLLSLVRWMRERRAEYDEAKPLGMGATYSIVPRMRRSRGMHHRANAIIARAQREALRDDIVTSWSGQVA